MVILYNKFNIKNYTLQNSMGNIGEYCGADTISIKVGEERIPDPSPTRGIQIFELDQQNAKVNYLQNNILFKPQNETILNMVLEPTRNQPEEITRKVQMIAKIDNQGQKIKTIHCAMKESAKKQEQVKQQTFQVKKQMQKEKEGAMMTPDDFKQIDNGFRSVGIDMDWTHKRGVASALSVHVLSGLTGNMVRCQFKETDDVRQFEYLIENQAMLKQHYDQIKRKIASRLDILEEYITIMEIEKGSVKTTFVINLDHIGSKIQNEDIKTKIGQSIQIHPYFEKFKLSPEDFDTHGNHDYTTKNVPEQQIWKRMPSERVKFIYNKPLDCKRFGLYVWDRYEDNSWLEYDNQNEWAIAYHGVWAPDAKSTLPEDEKLPENKKPVKISSIMKERALKPGSRNMYGNRKCLSPDHPVDCRSPVTGIYLTPDIEVAMSFAGQPVPVDNGKKYKLAFQCRVHPKHTHVVETEEKQKYWIVPESQYVRPYAIILKLIS